jgi:V8-like Glu-specific endopeptidase
MGNENEKVFNIESYQNEVIIDGQPLYEVKPEEHTARLHKYIGAILANNKTMGKSIIKGSGILISPDLVLTCAHNVWFERGNQENYNIKFYPGLCGPLKSSPCYDCSVVFYPEEHKKDQKPIYDYALLKLSQPILKKEDDFLPLSPSITGDLRAANQKQLAIYGYPGEKYFQVDSLGID